MFKLFLYIFSKLRCYNYTMKVKIEIDTRTFVRFWLVVIGFVLAGFAIYSASTALIIICASLFFAIALSPPVNRLAKMLPSKSRVAGTALAYVAVLAMLGVFIFLVIPPIFEQTVKFAQTVPDLVDSASKQYSVVDDAITRYNLKPEVDKAVLSVKNSTTQFATNVGSTLFTMVGSFLSFMMSAILMLVLTFLMLVEGPVWLNRLWGVYNDQDRMEAHKNILTRMYNVVKGYIVGQLSIAAIAGFTSGMVVFLLTLAMDIPTSLIIPTMAVISIMSLVPLFGGITGAVVVGFLLALNEWYAAVIFLAFYIIYQQIEANYISPKIQSKQIDLSPLAILIAVTIGIYLFGMIGGIISIPIAGCIKILVEDYFVRAKKNRTNSEKPINKFFKKIQAKD